MVRIPDIKPTEECLSLTAETLRLIVLSLLRLRITSIRYFIYLKTLVNKSLPLYGEIIFLASGLWGLGDTASEEACLTCLRARGLGDTTSEEACLGSPSHRAPRFKKLFTSFIGYENKPMLTYWLLIFFLPRFNFCVFQN